MTVPNDMENVQAFVFIYKLDLRRKSYRIFFKTLNCESMAGSGQVHFSFQLPPLKCCFLYLFLMTVSSLIVQWVLAMFMP